MFERYQRGHRGGGAGLGLYIARAIVEAHRGTIYLATAEGKGTVFRVKLPAAQVRWSVPVEANEALAPRRAQQH